MHKKIIRGLITQNYNSGIDIGNDDFIITMYDFANEIAFAKFHDESPLGGRKAYIPNCNMRMYFTTSECELDDAETALLLKLEALGYEINPPEEAIRETGYGDFHLKTDLIGYSEWTITGYDVDTCSLGGHDIYSILKGHLGEYVIIIVESEEF